MTVFQWWKWMSIVGVNERRKWQQADKSVWFFSSFYVLQVLTFESCLDIRQIYTTVGLAWNSIIKHRIQFKILSRVFLCINDLAPSYLHELLVQYCPSRNLRSQSKSLLVSPRIYTQFYGARSFQSSAPELWNNIPDKIKTAKTIDQFKAALKTHYFILNNWLI